MQSRSRVWRPPYPCEVHAILRPFRKGAGDPATTVSADGSIWRAFRTPAGTASLRVEARPGASEVQAEAWGDGAEWALESLPSLLGADDEPRAFAPDDPWLARAWARHPGLRMPRSGLVFEAAVAAVIEQKVTGQEAFRGWRSLLRKYGDPAPGPAGKPSGDGSPRRRGQSARDRPMLVPPSAETVARIPSWEWLRMHIDPARSKTAVRVARVASSLERTVGLSGEEADRRLQSVPGVGQWTSAEVRQRAHGDPDAVSLGDYNLPKMVGWTLAGEVVDDDAMEELLEPYRPHRHRVQRLVELEGSHPPRRGHRMAPRSHLPG